MSLGDILCGAAGGIAPSRPALGEDAAVIAVPLKVNGLLAYGYSGPKLIPGILLVGFVFLCMITAFLMNYLERRPPE